MTQTAQVPGFPTGKVLFSSKAVSWLAVHAHAGQTVDHVKSRWQCDTAQTCWQHFVPLGLDGRHA
jgi:myo-inositol catabolism protein IolC